MLVSQHKLAYKSTTRQFYEAVFEQIRLMIILYYLILERIFCTRLARFQCFRKKIDNLIRVEVV
jgi:hypothetical protein